MIASVSYMRAIGLALAGFTLWVLSDASMKLASETVLPPYEIVAFLGFFGAGFMLLKAARNGQVRALWPQNPTRQTGRACLALAVNICNVVALKHIPLTIFYVTVFTAPIVISLLASFVLKEHLGRLRLITILTGFAGVVIAVNPFGQNAQGDWIGYAAALSGVVFFAASTLWLRVMTKSESADSLVFFTAFIEMIAGFALMLWHAEPLTLQLFFILMMMGVFCSAGNLCNFTALRYTTAATVSQFHYTQIGAGALIGYIIWHEIPTVNLIVGTIIIIVSGLAIAAQKPPSDHAPDPVIQA